MAVNCLCTATLIEPHYCSPEYAQSEWEADEEEEEEEGWEGERSHRFVVSPLSRCRVKKKKPEKKIMLH